MRQPHTLVASVNGTEVKLKAFDDQTIGEITAEALRLAEVVDPAESWDMKDKAGTIYDAARTLGAYELAAEAVVYVSRHDPGVTG